MSSGFRLGYRPQLDGMRAIAVLAVMGFHASVTGAKGGYLGVEPFFVLSGFLITTLLVQERTGTGNIRLPAFYMRRALRLLPALAVFLAAMLAYAVLRPDAPEVQGFMRDFLATIAYVANWSTALKDQFDTRLLTHTWTLAVEEQFYLLWPVLLVVLLRRRDLRPAFAMACAGAVGLTAWRIALYRGGASLPRVAFSLDTRVGALLLGAAIAIAAVAGWLPTSRVMARVFGVVGFAWLAFIFLSSRYDLAAISFDPGRQYVEGILLTDVAAAMLLLGLLFDERGPVSRLLALGPMVWIGKVSYGLYLWHPAVDQIVTRDRTGLGALPNQALRLLIIAAVVAASYAFVELPFLRFKRRFERRPDVAVIPSATVATT